MTNAIATATAATFNADHVREAVLFLTNDADFYNTCRQLRENLAAKLVSGKWDADKARKALSGFIMAAHKSHSWTAVYGTWKLAKVDREQVAREVLEHYAEEIQEFAGDLMGPEFIAARVCNFDHDLYGNPTAQHLIGTSTSEGGFVKRLSCNWNPRRAQVGYGDYTDGVTEALKKVGIKAAHYTRTATTGSRGEDEIVVLFKRNEVPAI